MFEILNSIFSVNIQNWDSKQTKTVKNMFVLFTGMFFICLK